MKTFLNKLKTIDDLIIGWFETSYLWLFDWTGIYAATVMMAMVIFSVGSDMIASKQISGVWVAIFCVGINFPWIFARYIAQDKKLYTAYNWGATEMRSSFLRIGFIYVFSPLMLMQEIVKHEMQSAFVSIMWMCVCFMMAVRIRDREPKEWFKARKLAYNGA